MEKAETSSNVSSDLIDADTLLSRTSSKMPREKGQDAPWHPVEGRQRSDDIDKYLAAEYAKRKSHFKILVLGQYGQKDVFWKRARLQAEPLGEKDWPDVCAAVRKQLAEMARSCLVRFCEQLDQVKHSGCDATVNALNARLKDTLHDGDEATLIRLYQELAVQPSTTQAELSLLKAEDEILHQEWFDVANDPCMRPFSLQAHLTRVQDPAYRPTALDYVHFDSRRHGTPVREACIERRAHTLHIWDLVGVRGERKKWVPLFEDTDCVVFVADLALYNAKAYEDELENRLLESLYLFESIVTSRWFLQRPLMLVLVNEQTCRERLAETPPRPDNAMFSEYQGSSVDEAMVHLKSRFTDVARRRADDLFFMKSCDNLDERCVEDIVGYLEVVVVRRRTAT